MYTNGVHMEVTILFIIVGIILYFHKKKTDKLRNHSNKTFQDILKDKQLTPIEPEHNKFAEVSSPRDILANLKIKYKDSSGTVTERIIRLIKYGPCEDCNMLWAYCTLRKENRSFRTDRIISCIDVDTGEVIPNLDTWLSSKYDKSPDKALETLIETSWDVLRILYYVCKVDGRFTQKERAIVRDAVHSMIENVSIDNKRIDDLFDSIGSISLTTFKQAFGRLVKNQKDKALKVESWASELVATEKTISPGEQEALDYMRKKLTKLE